MFYIYTLKSLKDNNLHIGYSPDLKARIRKHNLGKVISTRNRRPLELIYYEAFKSEKDARKREMQLKGINSQREFLKRKIKESLK